MEPATTPATDAVTETVAEASTTNTTAGPITAKSKKRSAVTATAGAAAASSASATTTADSSRRRSKAPKLQKATSAVGTVPSSTTEAIGAPKKAANAKPAARKSSTTKTTASVAASNKPLPKTTHAPQQYPNPNHILVLDNGGDTVKYGWASSASIGVENAGAAAAADSSSSRQEPTVAYMPNVTARLAQQWTILVGDQLFTAVSNPNACVAVTRSTERGVIVNMGNQIQVWKRILDAMGIIIPATQNSKSESAVAFGWSTTSQDTKKSKAVASKATIGTRAASIPSHQCAVMIGIAPYTPRTILDQILTIWLDDFGFGAVGLCISAAAAAAATTTGPPLQPVHSMGPTLLDTPALLPESLVPAKPDTAKTQNDIPIACVVDLGWSAIHVVPVYKDRVIRGAGSSPSYSDIAHVSTIRRIPFGGRHLINVWKYTTSYRQWNLMDAEWILRDVWHQTAQLSLQYTHDMKLTRSIPNGRRPYDVEYVLPDYSSTAHTTGQVRIPPAVHEEMARQQRLLEQQQRRDGGAAAAMVLGDDEDNEDEESDDDYNEDDAQNDIRDDDEDFVDDEKGSGDNGGSAPTVDMASASDDDDDEESPEELRKRVLHERELERRRRDQEAQEQQVLNISVERFAIPEALFRPSDLGLPAEWANVPQAIVQAVTACPVVYRAALYQSIQLTGGLARLPNLVERLEQELRPLVPAQYEIRIVMSDSPLEPIIEAAWKGAARLATKDPLSKWGVSRLEWEQSSKRGAWKRMLQVNGGHLV